MSNTPDIQTEPTVFDLMEALMQKIEQYEADKAHFDAPCGDEPQPTYDEPTPAQLARERVLYDFETAFAFLTGGK